MLKKISVTKGTGSGRTELASFDAALFDGGIANYNLIKLSSIVPEGFEVVKEKVSLNDQEYGHRLYVVMSSCSEHELDKEAWAGVGWVCSKSGVKRGIFVEHSGGSREQVIEQIKATLEDMIVYRHDDFGPIDYEVAGIKCEGKPVSAIVAAIYQSEEWK